MLTVIWHVNTDIHISCRKKYEQQSQCREEWFYKEQGRYNVSESPLMEAIKGRRLKLGDTHPYTLESINNLIALYEAWNKPEEAEKWQVELA